MVHENEPKAVLAEQARDVAAGLEQENADLRAKLAALQGNVVPGRFGGDTPRYYLNAPVFLDDTLWPAASVIGTWETPNTDMVPQNEEAEHMMEAHLQHLRDGAHQKAALRAVAYAGPLVTNRDDLAVEAYREARQGVVPAPVVQMPTIHDSVPAMPHTDEARAQARRKGGANKKVVDVQLPNIARQSDRGAPILAPTLPQAELPPAIVGRGVA